MGQEKGGLPQEEIPNGTQERVKYAYKCQHFLEEVVLAFHSRYTAEDDLLCTKKK